MNIQMKPIGFVHTSCKTLPRHWTVSDVEGRLVIDKAYHQGLRDIQPGERIVVLFCFHKSPEFTLNHLCQTPPHKEREMGVFSICSPIRPNPIGLSVLEVLDIKETTIYVRGLDMLDQTPILDIKPHIEIASE